MLDEILTVHKVLQPQETAAAHVTDHMLPKFLSAGQLTGYWKVTA